MSKENMRMTRIVDFQTFNESENMSLELYHGSAREFSKFDFEKVGTGDGLNKYGFGLYFTDSPEVAEWYARDLALGAKKVFVYTVKVRGEFYEWEERIDQGILDKVVRKLDGMAFEVDAEQIQDEHRDFDESEFWSIRNLYEWLSHVLGGKKQASEFLSGIGIDGVYTDDNGTQTQQHGGKLYVAFSNDIVRITDTRELDI